MNLRLGLLLILLLFRFYDLGIRPPHHDEAVNGWFVDGIFAKGFYHYDPQNYHGPLFFYILTVFQWLFGRSIEVLRIPPVLFGMALSFTPFLFRRWITERGAWLAAFFFALSPAAIFYSRYTIHETAFAVSCVLFLYFWLLARQEGLSRKNIFGLGITVGAMAALKENFIMLLACTFIAEGCVALIPVWFKFAGKNNHPFEMFKSNPQKKWLNLISILALAFVVIAINFSAFGRDDDGIKNFFGAFARWSETGSKGNGHEKPWFYWIDLLYQYEWFALVGLLATPLVLMRNVATEVRLLSVLSFGLFLAYSIVNYKTPWCMLSFYCGFILVAAFWISQLLENRSYKSFVGPLVLGIGCYSANQAYQVAYVDVDSNHHPYIYGQTFRSFMIPIQGILDKVEANPELKSTLTIQVVSRFTWPLPWLLGEIKKVAYMNEKNAPAILDADYIIIDKEFEPLFVPSFTSAYKRTEAASRQWASPEVFYEKIVR